MLVPSLVPQTHLCICSPTLLFCGTEWVAFFQYGICFSDIFKSSTFLWSKLVIHLCTACNKVSCVRYFPGEKMLYFMHLSEAACFYEEKFVLGM